MIRIGLSYRGSDSYERYSVVLKRAAAACHIPMEVVWLGGAEQAPQPAETVDALCFTGGADVEPSRYGAADVENCCETDPLRDATEWKMLEAATRLAMPVLGICRGMQLLNVFHGGTLLPDLRDRNAAHRGSPEKIHGLRLAPGSLLAPPENMAWERNVNSSHHQAVDRLAEPFRATAHAPDGTIEAFEWRRPAGKPFLLAVQWHPERMNADSWFAQAPLGLFIASAAARAPASP